jgi:hypothetical protein
MTPTCLISLVGEQPVPNLLPVRYLEPDRVLLLYTDRTKVVADHLVRCIDQAEAYSLENTQRVDILVQVLQALPLCGQQPLYNLTGGTKPMALAAMLVAARQGAAFVYLETSGTKRLLHRYHMAEGLPVHERTDELPTQPALIDLRDYLNAYLGSFTTRGFSRDARGQLSSGGKFEKAVHDALRSAGFEVLAGVVPAGTDNQLEIDLVVRSGYEVAVLELKVGEEHLKKGLDQLAAATRPTFLGTYTHAVYVVAGQLNQSQRTLAREQRVTVIEVPGYTAKGLPEPEARRLVDDLISLIGSPGASFS